MNENSLRAGGLSAVSRITLVAALAALLCVLAAGVAYAASIDCPNRPDGVCVGTDKADNMSGTNKADDMGGRAGDDTLRGFGRGDELNGGIDDDVLYGQDGNDTLGGDEGSDELVGKGGDDRLNGGRDGDPDEFYCGSGTDTATIEVGDLVQTRSGELTPVRADSTESGLEAATTCENIRINLLQ